MNACHPTFVYYITNKYRVLCVLRYFTKSFHIQMGGVCYRIAIYSCSPSRLSATILLRKYPGSITA